MYFSCIFCHVAVDLHTRLHAYNNACWTISGSSSPIIFHDFWPPFHDKKAKCHKQKKSIILALILTVSFRINSLTLISLDTFLADIEFVMGNELAGGKFFLPLSWEIFFPPFYCNEIVHMIKVLLSDIFSWIWTSFFGHENVTYKENVLTARGRKWNSAWKIDVCKKLAQLSPNSAFFSQGKIPCFTSSENNIFKIFSLLLG